MYFKAIKACFVFIVCFLFVNFALIANETKRELKFDKIFPQSHLENLYKIISIKKGSLKDINNLTYEEYLDNSLDSLLDLHVFIYLLNSQIKKKKSYFKEDLENLRYFIKQIFSVVETNLNNYANPKRDTVKILFEKALYRLSESIL